MKDTFKKGLILGLGLASSSKEQAEKIMEELMTKGKLTREESASLLQELKKKGEESQQQLDLQFQERLKEWLKEMDVVTKEDLRVLEQRLLLVENQLQDKQE